METDLLYLVACISSMAAVISAWSAHKSSLTAIKALNLQINVELRSSEIDLMTSLSEDLKLLTLLKKMPPLGMGDDQFLSIPVLIKNIKGQIEKLKVLADNTLRRQLIDWEMNEIGNLGSIKSVFSNENETVFLKLPDDLTFLNESIKGLLKIQHDLTVNKHV